MNPDQVVYYMMRLPGVAGCFIVDEEGLTISSRLPPDFSEEVVFGMATDGIDAMETFKAEIPGCQEIRLDVEGICILIRVLKDHLLFMFIDEPAEMPAIRTGAKVSAKRYDPDEVPMTENYPETMSEIMARVSYDADE